MVSVLGSVSIHVVAYLRAAKCLRLGDTQLRNLGYLDWTKYKILFQIISGFDLH
jgi:hypothetical protein